MNPKKSVTERVLVANQANAGKSPGPRNTKNTRYNATIRGLLSSKLIFRSEDEKKSFDTLADELARYHAPVGPSEQALVSEVGIALWRLQELYGWEFSEIDNRKNGAASVFKALQENGTSRPLPLFAAAEAGWSADQLVVRTGNRSREEPDTPLDDTVDKSAHVIVEAKLTSSLDTILRYGAAIRRDLYRALGALTAIQRERIELNLSPVDTEEETGAKE